MPAKELKELRQAGKLAEAYAMAKAELEADLSNIWGKRNLSWCCMLNSMNLHQIWMLSY